MAPGKRIKQEKPGLPVSDTGGPGEILQEKRDIRRRAEAGADRLFMLMIIRASKRRKMPIAGLTEYGKNVKKARKIRGKMSVEKPVENVDNCSERGLRSAVMSKERSEKNA